MCQTAVLLDLPLDLTCLSMAFVDPAFLGQMGIMITVLRWEGKDLSHSACF